MWRVVQALSVATLLGAVFLVTDGFGASPFVVNVTGSLPKGLYVRTLSPILPGSIVRIPLPEVMADYIGQWPEWLAWLQKGGLLKPVVGVGGDVICRERRGDFSVNGLALGTAAHTGYDGRALPSWSGCQRLGSDQIAVFSDRIPDSMDSRMFGAVPASTAVAYRLLWEF